MTIQSPTSNDRGRRGMLLLLVLNVLALFLVVGALGILVATRARDSARAFAAAQASQVNSPALARGLLDEALLTLIRGPSANGLTECLLEDKYGSPALSGTLTAIAASGPLVTATITGTFSTANPATLNGRIVTFVPAAGDSTGPTSWRILRVNQNTTTYRLANVRPQTPAPLPSVFPCEAVINGREFMNEAYDAFDSNNPFLTQPVLTNSTVSSVARPAFGNSGETCMVDNDGDGVADGKWLDGVLPSMRSPNGGQLTFLVSCLVLDLDGRINLNAHGSFVRAQLPRNGTQYQQDPNTVPVGMGYGPADVDASIMVANAAERTSGAVPVRYVTLLQGGTVTPIVSSSSSAAQWRPTPRVGDTQAGRYGTDAVPGAAAIVTASNPLNPDAWLGGNSPSDLKGQLQVFTAGVGGGGSPTLTFFRPQPAWQSPDTNDAFGTGTAAHPYRLRLDDDASRAAGSTAADAPYTVAELERILRPFDADAAQLAPRLAAILDDYAERSRMTVTTDSWDTTAIAGSSAQTIASTVPPGDPSNVVSPETIAGLRFNLNRPIQGLAFANDRQAYFKHLYTLCVALGAAPSTAAQWAANVIEFRDPDSIMTWYPYDPNVLSGAWSPGSTGVWGAERPEVVIKQASASGNQATVNLYRPWAAACTTTGGSTIPAERIDNALGSAVANTLNVTRMDNANTGTNAVWRLTAGGTTAGLDRLIPLGTAVGTNADVGQATLTGSTAPTQVVLQRLADPTRLRNPDSSNPATYNDYVTVDTVSVPIDRGLPSRWLHWPNRDLVSHGELLTIQSGSAAELAALLYADSEKSLARTNPAILDATIVPTRFVGGNVSVANGATALAGTGYENFLYGQLSRWREPGRVNVNTILPNTGNTVWTALLGDSSNSNPVTSGPYSPIQSDRDLLVSGGDARFIRSGDDSAFLRRSRAIRLANVATTRSHVFAVWITLRITDSSANAGPPQFARLFAIVDRSIPVGYSSGRTLNVRETIRLQRFVE